jgi:phage terminase large subunit-like protein
MALCSVYGVKAIAVDPLFQSVQLCQQLQDEGLDVEYFKCNMVNLTAPTGETLRFINSGALRHGNNGFMRDQSANAVLSRRQEMCMPDKAKSAGKIDGIVTLIMSMATALLKRKPKGSVYETRGFITFGGEDDE